MTCSCREKRLPKGYGEKQAKTQNKINQKSNFKLETYEINRD